VLSAEKFCDYADEHFGWAETARTERERAIFLQMAAAWLEVAQRWETSAKRRSRQLGDGLPQARQRQHIADGHSVPLSTASRLNPALIEGLCNLPQRSCPGPFDLPNDRQDVCCVLLGSGFVCRSSGPRAPSDRSRRAWGSQE
jgi:hypothetical protein